jgi:GNAT superfamily N-acetyltransferase
MTSNSIAIKLLKGKEIIPFLSDLASLRISVFNEYPYLYVGDAEYEKYYLSTYAQCMDFVLVLIKDGEKVIGASTALPLKHETDYCKKAFAKSIYNVNDIFYLGESVLLPKYRKKGLYKSLFKYREEAAKAQGYKYASFCAVNRISNDPRQPDYYMPLDPVWEKYGYSKPQDVKAYFTWKEIGEDQQSEKEMTFWIKKI